jgi:hypothetical protein
MRLLEEKKISASSSASSLSSSISSSEVVKP